jgi:hypothetical protein
VDGVGLTAHLRILITPAAGVVLWAKPVRNVSSRRHPNRASAQRLCQQAWDKLEAAQAANRR